MTGLLRCARNDKVVTRYSYMCRSDALRPVRILVFVQTALSLVFTYSDSSRGSCATVAIQWIIKSRACARALFTGLLRYARNDKGEVRALIYWIASLRSQ